MSELEFEPETSGNTVHNLNLSVTWATDGNEDCKGVEQIRVMHGNINKQKPILRDTLFSTKSFFG